MAGRVVEDLAFRFFPLCGGVAAFGKLSEVTPNVSALPTYRNLITTSLEPLMILIMNPKHFRT